MGGGYTPYGLGRGGSRSISHGCYDLIRWAVYGVSMKKLDQHKGGAYAAIYQGRRRCRSKSEDQEARLGSWESARNNDMLLYLT
jgi:hypothetical protein